jgi:subtilisin family serine protease
MTLRNFRPPLRSSKTQYVSFTTVVALALLLGLAIVAYVLPSARAQNQPSITPKKAEFVPGELLVRFRPGTASARNKARASLSVSTSTGRTLNVQVVHFGGSDLVEGLMLARVAPDDTLAAISALRARADVAYAEPNFIRYPDLIPNDTHYSQLWGLKAAGGGINAETAWNTTTGSGNVVVGVVDSGIDIQHRDLKDNIFVNTGETPGNNVDDDGNGFIDDVNGWDFINHDRTVFDNASGDSHGTHDRRSGKQRRRRGRC